MLPYTGTFARWASPSRTASLAIDEKGGKLGGREIECFKVDDESDPVQGAENANKLVQRDKVDVLIGTVHSGVAMAHARKWRATTASLSSFPMPASHAATGALCAPNVFRTSFSNSQPGFAAGQGHGGQGPQEGRVRSPGSTRPAMKPFDGFKEASPRRAARSSRSWACPSRTSNSRRC